jgi:hypothetical protein
MLGAAAVGVRLIPPRVRRQAGWALGVGVGAVLTPFLLPVMLLRRARLFHPAGVIHSAEVVAPPGVLPGAPANLAARLAGPALVRFSGGLFAHSHRRDSLGLGLRFHSQPWPTAVYSRGDQDLALVTLTSFSLPRVLAGFRQTNTDDYLANTYWGIWPYDVDGFGQATLRLTATGAGAPGKDRAERLENAARTGRARLLLEVAPHGSDLYLPVAELRIGARLSAALQEDFSLRPASAGRGLVPTGFAQGTRVVPYLASRFARRHIRPPRSLPAPELHIRPPLGLRAGVAPGSTAS